MAWRDDELLSGTTGTSDIRCPFFSAHGRRAIQCKDIYPETKSVRMNFKNEEAKRFHEDTYCKANYEKCWLYWWSMQMMFTED